MPKQKNDLPVLREFIWQARAYIEDTDAGGIVYHGNYLNFMERARTESLRSLGFDKSAIFDADCIFVVHSLQIDYKRPATLDDLLNIEASVLQLKRSSILFRQNIYRGDDEQKELLSAAEVKIACIDKHEQRPCAIPDDIYDAIAQTLNG